MKLNKKTAMLFAGMGLLLGSIGAVGLQVHAQQTPSPVNPANMPVTQAIAAPVAAPSGVINSVDTNNVQNEVKDANEVNGVEINDKNEVKDATGLKDTDNIQNEVKDVNEVEDASSAKDTNEVAGTETNDGATTINQ
ncbi:MAG: hypothetical protein ACYC40_00370 [Patescibacteria group bacterium]